MNKNQFMILRLLERVGNSGLKLNDIKFYFRIPDDMFHNICDELYEKRYIKNTLNDTLKITDDGYRALEPFRVERAIFLAAGCGSRLMPITNNIPKPLIRVKGIRLIDTMLDAVVAAGINEIIIVRGHLGGEFDQLLEKYPHIRFVENPHYKNTNNISSAMVIRDLIKNAYVFEADLFLNNHSLIQKYEYCSNILGAWMEKDNDWCFNVNNGIINRVGFGGVNCYHWYGVSYYSKEDGYKLERHLPLAYNMEGGKKIFLEQVVIETFKEEYKICIRPCSCADIFEIDTISDLFKLDPNYELKLVNTAK